MAYGPEKHHRKSLRLPHYDYRSPGLDTICTYQRQCLLGEIVDGAMQLSEFVVMPNHIHGILSLADLSGSAVPAINHAYVGAGLANTPLPPSHTLCSKPVLPAASDQPRLVHGGNEDVKAGWAGFD